MTNCILDTHDFTPRSHTQGGRKALPVSDTDIRGPRSICCTGTEFRTHTILWDDNLNAYQNHQAAANAWLDEFIGSDASAFSRRTGERIYAWEWLQGEERMRRFEEDHIDREIDFMKEAR